VLDDGATQAAEQAAQEVSEDAVQAAEQATARVAEELAQENDLEVTHTYGSALEGFPAEIPAENLDDVRLDPRVDYVAEDRELRASAQYLPTGVNRVDADLDTNSVDAGNGSGTVDADIAVVDTGIYPHPDLNVVGGYNCTSATRTAWGDGNGHGTHVAGSATAKDDTAGVVGTAPGARLWALKVLDNSGKGSTSTVMCGVNYVTSTKQDTDPDNDIEVANMSLSGGGSDSPSNSDCTNANNDPLHQAICKSVKAGATYAVAAGNEGDNAARHVPAAYDEVITVSALSDYNGQPNGGARATCRSETDDDFASFSNHGSDVDIGAPGVCITSTWKPVRQAYKKRGRKGKRNRTVTGYLTISGTSMASAHAAGAAAVYLDENPSATPDQVRAFMIAPTNSEALGQGHRDSRARHPEPVLQMDNY
jgi:subtilisin